MRKQPLVSAIVSVYNSERCIRGKIEDLLNQTIVDNLEIIIVNSDSKENEEEIIQEYTVAYPNIIYLRTEERETIYKAWNRGIKISKGKYITNANADDRLKMDAFEVLVNVLEKDNNIALVYANQYISNIPNEKFNEIKTKKKWIIPQFDYFVQLDRCVVLSQPMWRSSLHFEDNIWFDENLEICGDHKFVLKIQKKYSIRYLQSVLGTFYVDKKRTNRSLNNLKYLEIEKTNMTSNFICHYINTIDEKNLWVIKKMFTCKVVLPIPILRGLNIIKNIVLPNKHQFTHEFVYYVYILICMRLGEYGKALYYSNKLLKRKDSARIKLLKEKIITKIN